MMYKRFICYNCDHYRQFLNDECTVGYCESRNRIVAEHDYCEQFITKMRRKREADGLSSIILMG
jgi:hypothetical protein